jgi:predicted ATPase
MAEDWRNDTRPIRSIGVFRDAEIDSDTWPATIPAVRDFLATAASHPFGGWTMSAGVTFLVGENGSGKSTIIEGIAEAVGLPPEGGTHHGGQTTRRSESPLGAWLKVSRGNMAAKGGFFLRAETMHGYFTWLEAINAGQPPGHPDARLHRLSHGESFNDLLDRKLDPQKWAVPLAILDEPEAALSFNSVLRWIASLDRMRTRGTQVICATHSPILASLPGAAILELGDWGIRHTRWEDLELVQHHRAYLEAPGRYLRHLLDR